MREGLLIDAYNLFHSARASVHARLFPDLKRLAYFLEHYASHHGLRVMMVVDGTRYADEITDTPLLRVLFSEGGQPADTVMEAWMARLDGSERLAWALVSNDLNLCRMGIGMGLRTRPCESLVADLAAFAQKNSKPVEPKKNPNFKHPFNNPFGHLVFAAAYLFFLSPSVGAAEFDGFAQPDSAVYDPATSSMYVSSVNGQPGDRDNNGFVSKISGDGLIMIQKFVQGSQAPDAAARQLHAPKGIAIVDGKLYAADIDTIRVYRLATGEPVGIIKFRRRTPTFLTGLAAGRKGELFVCDTNASVIYRVDTRGGNAVSIFSKAGSVARPRGLWFDPVTAALFVATAGKGNLYQIGMEGQPRLLRKGLGELGGITADENGNIYISGIKRGEVYRIADRGRGELSQITLGLQRPSGIGYDKSSGALMVPQSAGNRMTTIPLAQKRSQFIPKNQRLVN